MRPLLPSIVPVAILLLCGCGDDASTGETDDDSSSSSSSSGPGPSTGLETTSSAGTESSTTEGLTSSSSSGEVLDGSSSSGGETGSTTMRSTTTGSAATCVDEPAAPSNGSYESKCGGAEPGETCTLSCANGTIATADAECGEDGAWTEPDCADPFDQDGDGVRRYPWGADLDDDGDGEFTYLLGGDDYDDTDSAVQALSGDGTFTQGQTYALGDSAGPTGVAIGDWDNDGNVDIATTNQNNDTLSIFVGAGDGTFAPSQTIDLPSEGGGGRIKPADFDGDGNLDIVATFAGTIFTGAGDGTFADSGIAFGNCNDLHVFDANGDDLLDVLSFTYGNLGQLRVFVAAEDGSFSMVDTSAPSISVVAPGFIDGDTTMDVGLIEFGDRSARTFLGAGDGSFSLTDTMDDAFIYNAISIPRDLDGDGDADLLIGDFINDHISLVTGDGTGQLSETATIVVEGPPPTGLFSADLNADGSADIVYAAQVGGFSVAMGIGGGAFEPPTSVDIGNNEFGLEGADFNGDGRMDFAVINISSNDLVIMLGD